MGAAVTHDFKAGIVGMVAFAFVGCAGDDDVRPGPMTSNLVFEASDGVPMEGSGVLVVTVEGTSSARLAVDSAYTHGVQALKFGVLATDDEWSRLMAGETVSPALGTLADYRVDAPDQPIISRTVSNLRARWTDSNPLSITGDLGAVEPSDSGPPIAPEDWAPNATFSVTWSVSVLCSVVGPDGIVRHETLGESADCRAALERTGFGACLTSADCT